MKVATKPKPGTKARHEAILRELEIVQGNKEVLKPSDVVAWAVDHPESLIHECFEWNDSEAARQYRLEQARALIRIHIVQESNVPRFVSVSVDRGQEGGGYRRIEQAMQDEALRARLLQDALREFQRVQAKYKHLEEFAGVFREIDAVGEKFKSPAAA